MDVQEKLRVLADAAKYDVACTSSGSSRGPAAGKVGMTSSAGCCHAFSADGRCISLLKVLFTNKCIYDCSYCVNRRSNEVERAEFTPRELAELTIGFYRRNYIEGLFLSSGVVRSPDYTMERMIEALEILRGEYRFNGYIHAKSIPGASPDLVNRLGELSDRLSVNIELPSRESLMLLAPDKGSASIAAPMRQIRDGIEESEQMRALVRRQGRSLQRKFAPAGQATQMIIGATPETDLEILQLSKALYRRFSLKRVFFSAYLPVNDAPEVPFRGAPPLEREHRLYQADWLMRFYEFDADELLDCDSPMLDTEVDPKCAWALAHLDQFPVEINAAPYEMLLRVPGIGVRGAKAICRARRSQTLRPAELKRLGVSLKRAKYFVTCAGVYDPGPTWRVHANPRALRPASLLEDALAIRTALVEQAPTRDRRGKKKVDPNQTSLFDVPGFSDDVPVAACVVDARGERQPQRRRLAGPKTGLTLVADDAWLSAVPRRSSEVYA